MEKTWQQRLEFGRKSFACSSAVLLLMFFVSGYGVQDPLLRREAGFVFILSLVILAMSMAMWTCASYFTREIRAFFWITRRLGVFFTILFVAGLAAIKIYPSPDGSWPTTGDTMAITAAVGFLALLIAVAVDKRLSHPVQGA